MASTDYQVVPSNLHVQNALSCGSFSPPASSIGSDAINAASPIVASKLYHRHKPRHSQASGSSVAAATENIFIATADCVINNVKVFVDTAPIGVKTFTVDVKKSTGGGAFASILTAVVTVNSSTTNRSVSVGTLNGAQTMIAGDALQVVVAVAGASGTQALGVTAQVEIDEEPS